MKNKVWSLPVGTWLSLVEHRVRDAGAAGSNPVVPTTPFPIVFKRLILVIFAVKFPPVEPGARNVQKSDRRWLPHLLKSSSPGVAAFLNDRQCTGSRPLFWRRAHKYNCNFQGFSPDYIPWFFPPEIGWANAKKYRTDSHFEQIKVFSNKILWGHIYPGKMSASIFA